MNMSELQHMGGSAMPGSKLRGVGSHDVPMRKYTSWRAGGMADRMYQPADVDDLLAFLRSIPDGEPLYMVGLGSNLLVRDGGLRGTVLMLHGTLGGLHIELDGSVYAEAGVPGAKLARFAARHNLQGAEFFVGIPGTLGGMLAMNAGCYGSETWEKVLRVQTMNRRGEVHVRTPADYEIGYRHVALREPSEEWFVAAWLQFPKGEGETSLQEIKALLNKRIKSQPLNLPNAGSVFRNPPGDHAARLIQECGLKGRQIGGAQVSEKHANFIVNTGNATAEDIESLILEVQGVVLQKTGIKLHPEVRIVGEAKK
jgi:UDP-N-acetylmuramate dehydrogenase